MCCSTDLLNVSAFVTFQVLDFYKILPDKQKSGFYLSHVYIKHLDLVQGRSNIEKLDSVLTLDMSY